MVRLNNSRMVRHPDRVLVGTARAFHWDENRCKGESPLPGKESGARGRARKTLDPKLVPFFWSLELHAISNLGRLSARCRAFNPSSSMGG